MSCSAARLAANRANALKSTGPKSPAGKLASRRNSLKHGLTGQGVVVPDEDAAEIAARFEQFQAELAGDGSATTRFLAERLAVLSVRLDRSVRHEFAATAERVRRAGEAFDQAQSAIPETGAPVVAAETGVDRRTEAQRLALVAADPATLLARKYEAATERAIFRTLREIRTHRAAQAATCLDLTLPTLPAPQPQVARQTADRLLLGSFEPELSAPVTAPVGATISVGKTPQRGRSAYPDRSKRPRLNA